MHSDERQLLLVSASREKGEQKSKMLRKCGWGCVTVTDSETVGHLLEGMRFDLILFDCSGFSDSNAADCVKRIRREGSGTRWIVLDKPATDSKKNRARRLLADAFQILPYSIAPEILQHAVRSAFSFLDLERENQTLRNVLLHHGEEEPPVQGISKLMRMVFRNSTAAAPMNVPVLFRGESGTGKKTMAAEIHRLSPRADGPFVAGCCSGFSEQILHQEMFGHTEKRQHALLLDTAGWIRNATGGTLFLSDIADLSLLLQAKLMRILETGELSQDESSEKIQTNFRFLAGTRQDLEQAVAEGRFRDDLYRYLSDVQVTLPPLRERPEDIPVLANALGQRVQHKTSAPFYCFSSAASTLLRKQPFPGNVRELNTLVEQVVALAHNGKPDIAALQAAGIALPRVTFASPLSNQENNILSVSNEKPQTLESLECAAIRQALKESSGNMCHTARQLGISRSTLYNKVKRYQLVGVGKQDVAQEQTI